MTRLIDADKLCEEFKERQRAALRWKERAILDGDEERYIRADATLAFLSEVKLTIDKARTIAVDNYCLGYQDGLKKGAEKEKTEGEWIKDIQGDTICKNCGFECLYNKEGMYSLGRYCHHCGAKMMRSDEE